jgi:hypothetical protein
MAAEPEAVKKLISVLEKQQAGLTEQAIDVSYFSGGSVNYHAAWDLSYKERVTMIKKFKKFRGDKKEYL